MYTVGIDVGGTNIKFGIFSATGELISKWSIPTDLTSQGSNIFGDIASGLLDFLPKKNLSLSDISAIGMGVPGAARKDGSVNHCYNLGWGDIPAAKMISEILDNKPTAVINDANAAALGEQWQGAGSGYDNVVFVTIGTGIGGGIIVDGHIVTGAFGGAGEIGHITVNPNETKKCNCGKCGCVEQYASATGIVHSMKQYLMNPDVKSILTGKDFDAKDIFDAANKKDTASMHIVDLSCEQLAICLSAVSCTIDPDIFIIGGGVSAAGKLLIDPLKHYYQKYAFPASKNTLFKTAILGNDAGIYGAAKAALEKFRETL